MYNLIKSQNYTLRHDLLIVITIISLFTIPYMAVYLNGVLEGETLGGLTASKYMVTVGAAIPEIFLLGVMIFVAKAVGGDGSDKTINYELSSGHSRARVYWSRILTGYIWGVGITCLAIFIPYVVLTMINGWGDNISLNELMVRFAIMIFPMIRLAGAFMLATSLVGSAGGGMAICYGIECIEVMLDAVFEEMASFDRTYIFGISNLAKILTYNNSWEFVENGKTVTWFDYTTSNDLIIKTIVVSLFLAGIYVTLGYMVFKKRDNG